MIQTDCPQFPGLNSFLSSPRLTSVVNQIADTGEEKDMPDQTPAEIARTACYAVRQRKLLSLNYGGVSRIVEVHAVGHSTFWRELAYVWEVRSDKVRADENPWRLLKLREAKSATIVDAGSHAPRPGYERGKHGIFWLMLEV
jgi:hypothetical protein